MHVCAGTSRKNIDWILIEFRAYVFNHLHAKYNASPISMFMWLHPGELNGLRDVIPPLRETDSLEMTISAMYINKPLFLGSVFKKKVCALHYLFAQPILACIAVHMIECISMSFTFMLRFFVSLHTQDSGDYNAQLFINSKAQWIGLTDDGISAELREFLIKARDCLVVDSGTPDHIKVMPIKSMMVQTHRTKV